VAEAERPSAIGQALLAISDQWTMLILQRAFLLHIRRFADWRDELGISESVLAGRLKELVAGDFLRPVPYREEGRTRTEYLLTERAIELWPMLVEIWSWERRWVSRHHGLPELTHDVCGSRTDVELGCTSCGQAPVTARDTETVRAAATFAQVTVPRLHRRTVRGDAERDPLSYLPDTFELLGDRWSTVILVAAFLGARRFADFQSELGVAPSVLSSRLRRFTELGVLAVEEPGARPRYRLTEKGIDFFGIFAFIVEWAQTWFSGPPDTDLRITHRACGQPFRPYLRCKVCNLAISRTELHFVVPGDVPERRLPLTESA